MKLMVQSYNNGGAAYNAETEETAFLDYRIVHRFNEPAEAYITLADPTGTIAQKYNVDANDVYVGPGKVTIEDPTGTDVFYGRIMKATANTHNRTVELYCQDWLSQLNEEQITYDMREDLDGAGLRESTGHADPDCGIIDVAWSGSILRYAYADDGGAFTDETAEAQSAAANDMTLAPAAPAVNDAYYFGFYFPVSAFRLNVGIAPDWGFSIVWEYYNGAAWTSLSGLSDGTSSFVNEGENTVSWTVPADWTQVAVNGTTSWWIRVRVSAGAGCVQPPVGTQATGNQYLFFDDDMGWTNDDYNSMYLILMDSMAGTNTWGVGPYDEVVTGDGAGIDSDLGDETDLWVDDGNSHAVWDDDENWTQDYYFRVYLGEDSVSAFYVDDSISAVSVDLSYSFKDDDADAQCEVQIYRDTDADGTLDTWTDFATLRTYDAQQGSVITKATLYVPGAYVNQVVGDDGVAKIRFTVTKGTSNAYLYIFYIKFNVTVDTTGYSSTITINDTFSNRLEVATNLKATATHVWEGIPYCIARPIYKHIDSAESPGDLIESSGDASGDPIIDFTCDATIEHTSGISTRQYVDKTRLEILQDLARQDKAEFWIALGTATVNWKSTWNDGAADQTLSDTDVLSWNMVQDYGTLANKVTVRGMRIGQQQLESTYTDTTSTGKYIATRSRVLHDAGLVCEYDTLAKATAVTTQLSNVQKILTCTIRGNTETAAHSKTCKLGYEVQVTSTYLSMTNAWYIVQRFEYDSKNHLTTLLLHPRVSQTGLQQEEFKSTEVAIDSHRHGPTEKYVPRPAEDTI